MQLFSRSLLTLSVTLLAAQTFAGDVQQVSCNNGCGDTSCTPEGCNGRSDRCRTPRCRKGDYCDSNGWGDTNRRGGKNRQCNFRSTTRDLALDWAGPCSPAGRMARLGCPTAKNFVWCCKTKGSPDSGWAPPAHVPVTRTGGYYSRNWSNSAAGGYGAAAPMVYQPTDTTQLGYSYSNVPTWRPKPSMILPVPNPSNFHNRYCPVPGYEMTGGGCHGSMMGTEMIGGSCDMGYVQMMQRSQAAQMANYRGVRPVIAVPQPQMARPAAKTVTAVAQSNTPKSNVRLASQNSAQPWQKSQPRKTQQAKNVRRSATQGPLKRTARTQQRSGGWLGLPSLSEIKL